MNLSFRVNENLFHITFIFTLPTYTFMTSDEMIGDVKERKRVNNNEEVFFKDCKERC